MTTITPCLWFNGNAEEAVSFYTAAFVESTVYDTRYVPSEDVAHKHSELSPTVLSIEFDLAGQRLVAQNTGERYGFTPAISFMVNFDPSIDPNATEHLDALWNALIAGGTAVRPIDSYDFSPRYGWLRDKFGLSWQLLLTDPIDELRPKVVPSLIFSSHVQNRAHEAAEFYTSVFEGSGLGSDVRFDKHTGAAAADSVMFADFHLGEQWFVVMDATVKHRAGFTNAVSFIVSCDDQAEIDHYWAALSAVPDVERYGWCTDKFGVSWEITPANLSKLIASPEAARRLLEKGKLEVDEP